MRKQPSPVVWTTTLSGLPSLAPVSYTHLTGGTDRPNTARLAISILADELMINQIADQCRKLIPVLAVKILDEAT